jgi:hypothetical protein
LIKEFQRLKEEENNQSKLEWNLQRTLAKINYHIHTDAIKENLIPKEITRQQASFVYANEADLLNGENKIPMRKEISVTKAPLSNW